MASKPIWNPRNPSESLPRVKESEVEKKTTISNSVPDYVRVILVTDMSGRKRKLYIPAALDLDRPKRPRISFSPEQLKILELEFQENHFVSERRRQILAQALDLTETQIKVWFQNRRTKLRRQEPSPVPTTFTTFPVTHAAAPVTFPFPRFSEPKSYNFQLQSTIKNPGNQPLPPPALQLLQFPPPLNSFPRTTIL